MSYLCSPVSGQAGVVSSLDPWDSPRPPILKFPAPQWFLGLSRWQHSPPPPPRHKTFQSPCEPQPERTWVSVMFPHQDVKEKCRLGHLDGKKSKESKTTLSIFGCFYWVLTQQKDTWCALYLTMKDLIGNILMLFLDISRCTLRIKANLYTL